MVVESDLQDLYKLHSNPEVMHFIRPPEKSIIETKETLQKILSYQQENPGLGNFAAFSADEGQFIGWHMLKHLADTNQVELGYRLLPEFWGKGYATEMGRALIEYAKNNLNLKELVAITHPENFASQHVLGKLGFDYQREDRFYGIDVKFYQMNLV